MSQPESDLDFRKPYPPVPRVFNPQDLRFPDKTKNTQKREYNSYERLHLKPNLESIYLNYDRANYRLFSNPINRGLSGARYPSLEQALYSVSNEQLYQDSPISFWSTRSKTKLIKPDSLPGGPRKDKDITA